MDSFFRTHLLLMLSPSVTFLPPLPSLSPSLLPLSSPPSPSPFLFISLSPCSLCVSLSPFLSPWPSPVSVTLPFHPSRSLSLRACLPCCCRVGRRAVMMTTPSRPFPPRRHQILERLNELDAKATKNLSRLTWTTKYARIVSGYACASAETTHRAQARCCCRSLPPSHTMLFHTKP